jgi:hypothetical protein
VRAVSNAKSSAADLVISPAFRLSPRRLLSPPAGTSGQALGHAGSNKACQVREERLVFLGAPIPGLGQDSGAMNEEGAYPGVKIRAGLGGRARGRSQCVLSQQEAGSEDQAGLRDEGAECQTEQ